MRNASDDSTNEKEVTMNHNSTTNINTQHTKEKGVGVERGMEYPKRTVWSFH